MRPDRIHDMKASGLALLILGVLVLVYGGITYNRQKTGRLCTLRFGDEVAEILKRLPTRGPLFPKYSTLSSADRATRFAERVERLGITVGCFPYS